MLHRIVIIDLNNNILKKLVGVDLDLFAVYRDPIIANIRRCLLTYLHGQIGDFGRGNDHFGFFFDARALINKRILDLRK